MDMRKEILIGMKKALSVIKKNPRSCSLIPEVGMNIAYALPNAKSLNDVAVIPGRIRCASGKPSWVAKPRFGEHSHMARLVLNVMKHDKQKRSAMNIRYDEKYVKRLRKLGLNMVFVDRMKEPHRIAKKEWRSGPWILEKAIKSFGSIPDIIYDKGCIGKEPLIRIIGSNPLEIVQIAMRINL